MKKVLQSDLQDVIKALSEKELYCAKMASHLIEKKKYFTATDIDKEKYQTVISSAMEVHTKLYDVYVKHGYNLDTPNLVIASGECEVLLLEELLRRSNS